MRIWSSLEYALGLNVGRSGFNRVTTTPVVLGGVARLGAHDLAMLAADTDGRVHLNRFVGAEWMGFAPLAGQPQRTGLPFKSPIALH